MGVALLFLAAARAACPADIAAFRADLDAADAAYADFDFETFSAKAASLGEMAGCLLEPATPADASRLHRVRAMDCWVRRESIGDSAQACVHSSIQGLVAVDPTYQPPDDLMPQGSEIRDLYEEALGLGPGATEPAEGEGWLIDGTASAEIPRERASLVQYFGVSGVGSWYLVGEQLPDELKDQLRQRPSGGRPSRALLIAGLASGAAAGAGLGVAAVTRSDYREESDLDQASKLASINQITGISGYALGAAAGGLVVSAVVVGRW